LRSLRWAKEDRNYSSRTCQARITTARDSRYWQGNIIVNGTHEAGCGEIRSSMQECERIFNSRTGTAYDRIRNPEEIRYVHRTAQRRNERMAIARTVVCSNNTVQRWTRSTAEKTAIQHPLSRKASGRIPCRWTNSCNNNLVDFLTKRRISTLITYI
jgi:hypothetical protein